MCYLIAVWYTAIMNRKKQGDLGVAAAIWYYTKLGNMILIPNTDNSKYDLVVDNGTNLIKIQCKTTGYKKDSNIYSVQLSTQGGNQSWNRTRKFISSSECDLVFVYCLDGTAYEIPVARVAGKSSLNLGKLCEQYKINF